MFDFIVDLISWLGSIIVNALGIIWSGLGIIKQFFIDIPLLLVDFTAMFPEYIAFTLYSLFAIIFGIVMIKLIKLIV